MKVTIKFNNITEKGNSLIGGIKEGDDYRFVMFGDFDKDVFLELSIVLATGLYRELSKYYSPEQLDELFKLLYLTAKE
jgi:hypothetical protein